MLKKLNSMDISTKKKKYSQICRILDEIEKQYNFCNINTVEGRVTCNGIFRNKSKLCCTGCHNLTKNGCRAKSIYCKLSYCYIGEGPKHCRLVKTDKQNVAAKRRANVWRLIRECAIIHDIPMLPVRASMSAQFKIQKALGGRTEVGWNEIGYDTYKARFTNK